MSMEKDQFEFDVDTPLAIAFNFRKKRKLQPYSKCTKKTLVNKNEKLQISTSIVARYEEVAYPIREELQAFPNDSILHEEVADPIGEKLKAFPNDSIIHEEVADPIVEELQAFTNNSILHEEVAAPIGEKLQAFPNDSILHEEVATEGPPGMRVSFFDYSVENHFKSVHTMLKLCGEHDAWDFNQDEIQRLSSSITFLKQWRDFKYKPKTIKFACRDESMNGKNVIGEISLPQFSSVAVPKDLNNEKSMSAAPSEDIVLHAGGSVWALDWCPRANKKSVSGMKMEFVAVAAHPPGSSYHKIGSPLTGRGAVQIWCMLDVANEENSLSQDQKKRKRKRSLYPSVAKRPRGRPRKHRPTDTSDNIGSGSQELQICVSRKGQTDGLNSTAAKMPRRGSKRKARNEVPYNLNSDSSLDEPLAIHYPGDPLLLQSNPCTTAGSENDPSNDIASTSQCIEPLELETIPFGDVGSEHVAVADDRNNPALTSRVTESKLLSSSLKYKRLKVNARIGETGHGPNLVQDGNREVTPLHTGTNTSYAPDSNVNLNSISCRGANTLSNSTPADDVPLPRMMLCLAHNGKVVWDLKWRPSNSHDKVRLGYLAVLLGTGSIEVWDVPFPSAVEVVYSSSTQAESTDPRFIKLEPVFRCSKLNCRDNKSIPLTVEWSTSSPHDMIVAGCHDGVVALWKFSAEVSCKETKPLLRFTADTVPIRTIAWAPAESDCESSNVIVTGGNKGLKFWDIRDPFHPLWEYNPVQMNILSLDWLPDPRCVVMSFDDGTLRVLSLKKAANDVAVTGKPFTGTIQQGTASYVCSTFAIWDVHVSKKTGMVAYCGMDGNTLRFQLTTRTVERDPLRNRASHFLCGSLSEEESEFTVGTPQNDDIPFPMKNSLNEWGDVPRSQRGFLFLSNQKKREKEAMEQNKISNELPLALCYGDDLGGESDTDPLIAHKTKHANKSATKRTSKTADPRALTCRNENPETSRNGADEKGSESCPPKSIAIHSVRWNMNEGSERWLCYGGAAGIVRLQKVDISIG